PLLETAKSSLPSPLKSEAAIGKGFAPTLTSNLFSEIEGVAFVISKYVALEVPPPGVGLNTVTEAVPGKATSATGTVAVNRSLLINVVANPVPFHLTVAPGTNPVPVTVRLKACPPGATAVGTKG